MRAPLASGAAIALYYHLVQVTAHSAKALRGIDNVYKHSGYVDHQVRRNADAIINHGLYHGRNIIPFPTPLATSSPSLTASTPLAFSATAPAEPQGWDNQTQAACMTALTAYINPTNPSGMAVCYNIPYFNNATGAFEADLRLYRVTDPSGDWTGFTEQRVTVGLSYPGATVAASRMPMSWNQAAVYWPQSPRDGIEKRGEAPPLMLQFLDLVGMVNGDLMGENKNDTEWQFLLLPHIILSGLSQTNIPISTNLSSTAAAFVSGFFAEQESKLLAGSLSASAATSTPFVLPGTCLGIFPVGLIITSVWTVLFIAVVGYGTVSRIRFREQYRRRVRRGNMGVVKTI